jgi:D,D-heptose 1,7-bisphosphate phosphatase
MNIKYNAAILCGGYGSRLLRYTKKIPKPLLLVSGKPFLYYLIKNIQRYGLINILLFTHYKSNLFYKFKKEYFPHSSIRIINEKTKLGTAGCLIEAKKYLDRNFFLFNGDTYFDFNFLDLRINLNNKKLIRAACTYKENANYSLKLSRKSEANHSNIINKNKKNLVFGGVYLINKKVLKKNTNVKLLDLDNDIIFPLLKKKKISIKIYKKNKFFDIGDNVESYHNSHNNMKEALTKNCCFLDRDGTINFDKGYVYKIKDFKWKKDSIKAIKFLNDNNYYVIVITNQSGIARGYFKENDVENLHRYINTKLFEKGAHIDKFYYCPFHEQAKILKYKKRTNYRKPGNGMLLEALRDFKIKKNQSFFIGDQKSDEICAKKTSIKFEFAKGSILNIVKKKFYENK